LLTFWDALADIIANAPDGRSGNRAAILHSETGEVRGMCECADEHSSRIQFENLKLILAQQA
jgi:hypothetical protein